MHKGFGLKGALTNGLVRDLGDLPEGFPVIAGSTGPSHAFVHVREVACEVTIFGLTIRPEDWVHADRHGAVGIPEDLLGDLEAAIPRLLATERIVLDAARRPGFDFDAFATAWEAFEKARVWTGTTGTRPRSVKSQRVRPSNTAGCNRRPKPAPR